MFKFLKDSIHLANNYDYLDRLYRIYPITSNVRRNIQPNVIDNLYNNFIQQNNEELIKSSLALDLFPIKDSYVAFLKRYPHAISLNPSTIDRLAGEIYALGWDKLMQNITEPKETNRQMGSLFKNWLEKKELGLTPVNLEEFEKGKTNAILKGSDAILKEFACRNFQYSRNKGLDLVARFNGKYIIGEAKFLTDFGGHQNAQFEDALATVEHQISGAIPIAILDGVLYINAKNKMHQSLLGKYKDKPILSALLLKEFLYSL